MSQDSIEKIQKTRYEAVDDPDSYPWKVVDTATGEIAACAIWAHTKAMSDEDWDRDDEKAVNGWPEARHDILDPFVHREQETKRKIMGHTRWWGKIPILFKTWIVEAFGLTL